MIKVLQIVNGLHRTGVQSFIINALRQIKHSEISFDFLVFEKAEKGYEEEAESLGARIYYYTPRKRGIIKHIRSLDEFFRDHGHEYAAVHYHGNSFTELSPLKIARKYGVPIRVAHSHNSTTPGLHNKLLHWVNKKQIHRIATHYLACSENAREWGYGKTKVHGESIVAPNGIEISSYKFNKGDREEIRAQLKITPESFVLCHTGGFREVKNHSFLLEIFEEIRKKRPDSVLILCGTKGNEEEIRSLIADKKLDPHIRMVGLRKDVHKILSASDAEVFPSLYEGLPFALVEAQANGLPVYASDVITPEIKLSRKTHLIPLSKSAREWADIILQNNYEREEGPDMNSISKFDIGTTANLLRKIYYGDVRK